MNNWALPGSRLAGREQLPGMAATLTGVIFEVVRLIEDDPGPGNPCELVDVPLQKIVVQDYPIAFDLLLVP